MATKTAQVDGFIIFARDIEPRLRLALCSGFGRQVGLEATEDALAYGWEHWGRIQGMTNPAGYLYAVGRNPQKVLGEQLYEQGYGRSLCVCRDSLTRVVHVGHGHHRCSMCNTIESCVVTPHHLAPAATKSARSERVQ